MRVRTGRVVGGTIHLEGEQLEEGSVVTVVVHGEGTFELTSSEERELLEAMKEADAGTFVSEDELFAPRKA